MNIQAPYIRTRHSVPLLMGGIAAAAFFITALSSVFHGYAVFLTFAVCTGSAAAAELIYRGIVSRTFTLSDLSAVATGSVLAVLLPAETPLWLSGASAAIAILAGKQLFGGLGRNIFNPALAGLLAASAAGYILHFHVPAAGVYGTPSFWIGGQAWIAHTPVLAHPVFSFGLFQNTGFASFPAAAAVLVFLFLSGILRIEIPLFAWAGAAAVSSVMLAFHLPHAASALYFLMSGGFIFLSSVVMTDPVTSPLSSPARALYGFICGIAVSATAMMTGSSSAAVLSLLACNALVPGINRLFLRR